MPVEIQAWQGILPNAARDAVFELYFEIFGQSPEETFKQKWTARMNANSLSLLAFSQNKPVGYKVGYAIDNNIFYSWLGGVLPEFRGQGIGVQLLEQQHEWCHRHGFKVIRTKTMNRWKNMLMLNLRHGFDIIETYKDSSGTLKIVLEKKLEG